MSDTKNIVVSYDISDPHRLAKIGKAMKDYGQRVLMSVFECTLNESEFEHMMDRMFDLMDNESDSVRYYFLCDKCVKRVTVLGKKPKLQKNEDVVII